MNHIASFLATINSNSKVRNARTSRNLPAEKPQSRDNPRIVRLTQDETDAFFNTGVYASLKDPEMHLPYVKFSAAPTITPSTENLDIAMAHIKNFLDEYQKKVTSRIPSWIRAIDAEIQLNMAFGLITILEGYKENKKTKGVAANEIIELLKQNQDRHDKSIFTELGPFIIETLKSLPQGLKKAIYEKIDPPNGTTLNGDNYSAGKLEEIISKYTLPRTPAPTPPPDTSRHRM